MNGISIIHVVLSIIARIKILSSPQTPGTGSDNQSSMCRVIPAFRKAQLMF